MEEVLRLIESYGLSVVLLLGSLYALYKFFFFSIHQVKNEFGKRHDLMIEKMEDVKEELSKLRSKTSTILEFIKKKEQ